MTEIELLRELDNRLRKVVDEKRQMRKDIRENANATHWAVLCADAADNACGKMYSAFVSFFEELGYKDRQIWNYGKANQK